MDRLRRELLIAAGGLVTSVACPGLILPARAIAPFKETVTTLFWVGEASGEENAFIPNDQSYWDQDWQDHYGGVDDPESRSGHWPADFKPKENPFYVALPYGEFNQGQPQWLPGAAHFYGPQVSIETPRPDFQGVRARRQSRDVELARGTALRFDQRKVPRAAHHHACVLYGRAAAVHHYTLNCGGLRKQAGGERQHDQALDENSHVGGSSVSPAAIVEPEVFHCIIPKSRDASRYAILSGIRSGVGGRGADEAAGAGPGGAV